jgi:hypothetical protein
MSVHSFVALHPKPTNQSAATATFMRPSNGDDTGLRRRAQPGNHYGAMYVSPGMAQRDMTSGDELGVS